MKLEIDINGERRTLEADPGRRLLDLLREDLRMTGTKEGCGEGECGACTVLLDGKPVNACLVASGQCHGRAVTTVEGLARHEGGEAMLHEIQAALLAHGAAQCGSCTPGIAVCATALIEHGVLSDGAAARDQVRELLAGNICRCTGYQAIVDAVIAAARAREAKTRGEAQS